ncbi:MAG: DNA internalization-related competence protein ComEC/Rec2 [Hydrogenophilales bacterium]|nr:DNA internalization-related competence protein ComEC/Rec2 [Hydrogenophilales bacterium]
MRLAILAFVAGIGCLQQQAVLPNLAWAALLLLTPLALFIRVALLRQGLWLIAAFTAGFFWAAGVAQHRLTDALPAEWEGRDIQVIGVVAELPQFTERGVRFAFDVEEVVTPHAKAPAHIQLFWFARANDADNDAHLNPARLHAGERWQLVVRLKRPHGAANPYGFDYEAWLLEQNVRATGYIRKDPNNFRLNQFVLHPAYAVERLRDAVALRLKRVMQDEAYASVLTALAIGDQHAIPQSQWRVFFRTGVNHLMSISGLHVTLFSSLVFVLVYWLWRQSAWLTQRLPARKAALLFGVAAAFAYALLTGFAVPAQRTFYMLSIVAAAVWFDRLSSSSRVLALALGVVALLDPWAVLSPGFWLSFGAVAVIFYITSQRIGEFKPWIQALRVQGAVTLGLVPAMLLLFQQVSLVSPLANAVAIPVVSYLIVPLTLLGALVPVDFPLHAAHGLMAWLMLALEWFASAPDAMWQQHAPPGWTILVALMGMAWLLAPRGFPARLAGACLLLPMFLLAPMPVPPGTLQLTVLDVGQGLALVLRTARHALVYDTGSRFSSEVDAGARTVLPYLRATGVSALDGLIISHDDNDHSGGALSVLDGVPVQWLLSSLPAEHPALSRGVPAIRCEAGQHWQWDGVVFEVLHPMPDAFTEQRKDNDRGCVLRVVVGKHALLLPADIEAKSERDLLARTAGKLRADVLIVPHHGSRTSSTDEFVAAVQPEVAIFTVGYRNRFHHPRPEVVARYQALNAQLLQSDAAGAIEVTVPSSGAIDIQSYRKQNPRYWRGR